MQVKTMEPATYELMLRGQVGVCAYARMTSYLQSCMRTI